MKKFRIISFIMTAMLCAFAACQKEEPVSVEFKAQTYQLKVGDTMDINAELVIKNTDSKPEFKSSDASVASVGEDGLVTANASGEAVITAIVEGRNASCTISVSEIEADNITLAAPESLIADGAWGTVKATVEPEGYNAENLEWTFTPGAEGLEFETEKVKASEYKVCFKTYVDGGNLTVKVADKLSGKSQTAEIAVAEKVVPATRIALEMPEELTEGEDLWATISASVTPEEYDVRHLVWEFEPSDAELGFKYEKVSDTEYKVCFAAYVPDGFVTVTVSDELSEVFNQGRIRVLEKPEEGLRSLSLSPAALALNVGDEPVTLQVVYEPEDYDKSLLEWTSSDENVATVADGIVTVVGEGEAVIKIKDKVSEKEASCTVTVTTPVKEAVVSSIVLSKSNLEMRVGEEAVQIVASCYDEDNNLIENYAGLVWSAAKMTGENGKEVEVVEVTQQGIVTPKNPGSTQVLVVDKDNEYVKAVCNVTVKAAEIKVEGVKLVPESKVIDMEDSFRLNAVITPENAENKTLTYASSDPEVATVTAEGLVTGVKPGKAVITATSVNGVKGECEVTVAEETWVYLSNSEMTLVVGEEKTLTATVTPENAPDKTVTWTSSDPEVASVDGGKVKGLKEGTAVITAAANGKSAECKVTVEPEVVDFDINIVPVEATVLTRGLQQDKSVRLLATYERKDNGKSHTPTVTEWKSSDETVATVDSEGNVTAVIEHIEKSGIENGVEITITHVADGIEEDIKIVVVKAMPEQVVLTSWPSVDGVDYKMMHGETFTFTAKVLPEKASQEFKLQCSDYIAFVENGVYYAAAPGNVTFTLYAGDDTGVRHNFSIEVLPVKATGIEMTEAALDMTTGASAVLGVNITPANASYKNITWSSSDETVVVVDQNGNVTAKAAGNAVITAYQPENDISCTCDITVTDPVIEINIGDYYYSDGTWSTELNTEKTVIGVVFAKANTVTSDAHMAVDHPDCTRGLVVSMAEYATPFTEGAHWTRESLITWMNDNGYTQVGDQDKCCGYGNTKGFVALNAANVSSEGDIISVDICNAVTQHSNSVQAPQKSSGWYIPSYAEMKLLYDNLDMVNSSIESADGEVMSKTYVTDYTRPSDKKYFEYTRNQQYWFAYVGSNFRSFDMNTGTDTDPKLYKNGDFSPSSTGKSAKLPVRVILAF